MTHFKVQALIILTSVCVCVCVCCTLYGDGSILSPNSTWPKFSDGRFSDWSAQKSNLKEYKK